MVARLYAIEEQKTCFEGTECVTVGSRAHNITFDSVMCAIATF